MLHKFIHISQVQKSVCIKSMSDISNIDEWIKIALSSNYGIEPICWQAVEKVVGGSSSWNGPAKVAAHSSTPYHSRHYCSVLHHLLLLFGEGTLSFGKLAKYESPFVCLQFLILSYNNSIGVEPDSRALFIGKSVCLQSKRFDCVFYGGGLHV